MQQQEQYTYLSLGIEISTQSAKAIIIENNSLQQLYQFSINFQKDLPHYQTQNGVYISKDNPKEITSNTYMFLEAIDIILQNIHDKLKIEQIQQIQCISFSGQQHGSIYWKLGSLKILQNLDQNLSLLDNFKSQDAFSIPNCPIWMDSSTSKYCKILEESLESGEKNKGAKQLAGITGSKAYERFTASQIMKIMDEKREEYQNTAHISLISQFLHEIFTGKYSTPDLSDGSGMNMIDIQDKQWSQQILKNMGEISGQSLQKLKLKLGLQPISSHSCVGDISKYFVERYQFNQNCKIIAATGDNPSSLAGLGLFNKGDIAISLGTSDTMFGFIDKSNLKCQTNGHILINPIDNENYMLLLCTKNGSLIREKFKQKYANNDQSIFDDYLYLQNNKECIGIFLEHPEIVPEINKENFKLIYNIKSQEFQHELERDQMVQILVQSKILSLKYNAEKFGVKQINRCMVTGGASQNKAILQIMADILQTPIITLKNKNIAHDAALYGAALRAIHGYEILKNNQYIDFKQLFENKFKEFVQVQATPNESLKQVYDDLYKEYAKFENNCIEKYQFKYPEVVI